MLQLEPSIGVLIDILQLIPYQSSHNKMIMAALSNGHQVDLRSAAADRTRLFTEVEYCSSEDRFVCQPGNVIIARGDLLLMRQALGAANGRLLIMFDR